ncbi:cell surface glycoprotein CD200 receptor 5-like [Dendropsophus ebraccatus]|uniref:cell surface glycoprotein CD200 receptor 5-like n=1 Tax=Dendropsophus ebraccatus TaxID=150705 RepID=UPI0038317898
MDRQLSVRLLMSLVLFYSGLIVSDVVRVRRGQPAVLQCDADPGDTLLQVTWKLHLYNSSCIISYKIEEGNAKKSHSSCSTRVRSDNLSLSITNTEVSDGGRYTCEVVYGTTTVIRDIVLQVIDVVRVRRGQSVVLQCDADPGDTLLQVAWKLHLYNSSCIISYRIEEDNTKSSYSSCSTRVRISHSSLSISSTEVSDGGKYSCEVVHDTDTTIRGTLLQVLAQPSTYLTVTSDGSPECGAIGGNPPAEISWIPHSDDINTTVVEEPDRTWSVISTLRRKGMNETSVTCVVSHTTLGNPWKGAIVVHGYRFTVDNIVRIIITVISTVLMAGLLLYLKVKSQALTLLVIQ